MSIFIIKTIAYVSMFLDHVKYAIPATNNEITIYLGRLAFPLFAFLITEGYIHTKDLEKYNKRLVIFALISQIPFMLFRSLVGNYLMFNVLFTLILGLLSIIVYDKIEKKYISIPIVLFVIWLGGLMRVDYGWYGVALVFILYLFRKNKFLLVPSFIALNIAHYYKALAVNFSIHYIIMLLVSISSIVIILLYNGKQGKKLKYLFYWFYPVHMLILYLINIFFIN